MLDIWLVSGAAAALVACILLIAMCTHAEDNVVPETTPVEKDPENPQPVRADGQSAFRDPLEEISENVTFHVIPNSNKKVRAQDTPSPKKQKSESSYESESESTSETGSSESNSSSGSESESSSGTESSSYSGSNSSSYKSSSSS